MTEFEKAIMGEKNPLGGGMPHVQGPLPVMPVTQALELINEETKKHVVIHINQVEIEEINEETKQVSFHMTSGAIVTVDMTNKAKPKLISIEK